MKHYKHVFTEWICKLRNFPMLERSAFRDLVEDALARSEALPLTLEQAYRVCGAVSRPERSAVRSTLANHFVNIGGRYSCQWAESLLRSQFEQQERLRQLKAGSGWSQFRDEVLERDGYRCVYCGAADVNLHLDHVFPRSRGGIDHPDNLAAACPSCNSSKGAKTVDEWRGARAESNPS